MSFMNNDNDMNKGLIINHLSTSPAKRSKTQTMRRLLPTNCLGVFNRFLGLALKWLRQSQLAFTCLKSTMETAEQCVKSVQS